MRTSLCCCLQRMVSFDIHNVWGHSMHLAPSVKRMLDRIVWCHEIYPRVRIFVARNKHQFHKVRQKRFWSLWSHTGSMLFSSTYSLIRIISVIITKIRLLHWESPVCSTSQELADEWKPKRREKYSYSGMNGTCGWNRPWAHGQGIIFFFFFFCENLDKSLWWKK